MSDTIIELLQDYAAQAAKRAESAKTSPSLLIKKEVLKRDRKDIKKVSRSLSGRTCHVVYYRNGSVLGIPIWRKYGTALSPGGEMLVEELLKGVCWNAWDTLGRRRYREGESIFYKEDAGHEIRDNGTAEVTYI